MYINNLFYLTIDRPHKANAFDGELVHELHNQLLAVPKDTKAVIISSKGNHFSAGADLSWMLSMSEQSVEVNKQDAQKLDELLQLISELPMPVIAITHGMAIGGAVGILACADIVLAHENASFALTESALGLVPAIISRYLIAAIGPRAFKRLALIGDSITVDTAYALGLVHYVYTDANKTTSIDNVLSKLDSNSLYANRAIKQLAENYGTVDRAELLAVLRTTEDAKIRMKAFLNKRHRHT